jgi:hypothetical protein
MLARPEVHLVRRLTSKRRMGQARIMLGDVETDQLLQRSHRIEGVQIQPLVLERPPLRLDERIGKADLGHGHNALQKARNCG